MPAIISTESPGLINSSPPASFLPLAVAEVFSVKPELLIASATVLAVTNESPLPTGAPTLPSVDGVKVVVTAAMLPLPSTLTVVPSVFAATV